MYLLPKEWAAREGKIGGEPYWKEENTKLVRLFIGKEIIVFHLYLFFRVFLKSTGELYSPR